MFFPIGDDNKDRQTTPYINYLFIILNILVFVFMQGFGRNDAFTFAYATVPAEILSGNDIVSAAKIITNPITGLQSIQPPLGVTPIPVYLTLLTSTFMHGGLAHIAGNLWFLWIFGDNIEDAMGHKNYFFFYLLCGVFAGLSHVLTSAFLGQSLYLPSLGASGAISGVMGGYLLLFPRRSVRVWIFFFIVSVPAFLAVGVWFIFQLINGAGMLGGEEAGGVAYAAHIGGFVAGFLLVKGFAKKRKAQLIKERKSRW